MSNEHHSNPNGFDHEEIRRATVLKLEAEAARARAEADACSAESAANTRRLDAEASRLAAEQDQLNAEKDKLQLDIADQAIRHRWSVREEKEKLTSNIYHHTIHYSEDVSGSSVSSAMRTMDVWRRMAESEGIAPADQPPYNIIFTSPGGSIIAGLVFYDYLQDLKRQGHRIITGTYGMAASMSGILLQAGTERWISAESWLMIHEASFGVAGKIGEVEDHTAWVKMIQERIVNIFATRAHMSQPNHSLKYYKSLVKRNWRRKDWWLSSDEALSHGFVDRIDSTPTA